MTGGPSPSPQISWRCARRPSKHTIRRTLNRRMDWRSWDWTWTTTWGEVLWDSAERGEAR
jgi:hypothetical protein